MRTFLTDTVSETEVFVDGLMGDFLKRHPAVSQLGDFYSLANVDYWEIGGGKEAADKLEKLYYFPERMFANSVRVVMKHPHPYLFLPRVVIRYKDLPDSAFARAQIKVSLRCSSLDNTRKKWNCKTPVWGSSGEYIYCLFNVTSLSNVILVERRNPDDCVPLVPEP